MIEVPQSAGSQRIAVRYSITFAINLVRAALGFLSGVIVAGGLGPSRFGDYSFLLASFVAVTQLLEAGTSSAFYTLVARRPRGPRFLAAYAAWLLFQFVIAAVFVAWLLPDRLFQEMWVGHDRSLVLLSLGANFVAMQLWPALMQLAEARRLTLLIQTASGIQAVVHLVAVLVLREMGLLSVPSVLVLLVAEYGLLAGILAPRLVARNIDRESDEHLKDVVRQFADYCAPLVLYGLVGFAYTFADRWFLQRFGGSTEQGLFSVAQQFAAISLLATTSILRVFWKEIAEAKHRGDAEAMRVLYQRISRTLYFATAWCSALLIPYSSELLQWTVGSGFVPGAASLTIMLFYPLHQSLGQIQSTFLYASGETKLLTGLGTIGMLISLPIGYVLLAPAGSLPIGLGLGAVGLAVKLVLVQVIMVNITRIAVARRHGWPHDLMHQLSSTALLVFLAILGRQLGSLLTPSGATPLMMSVRLAIGLVCYVVGTSLVVWRLPTIVGITRSERDRILNVARGFLGRRHATAP